MQLHDNKQHSTASVMQVSFHMPSCNFAPEWLDSQEGGVITLEYAINVIHKCIMGKL